jgi:CheY-like chemotaxis protein
MPKVQALELNPLVERTCALLGRVLDSRLALLAKTTPDLPRVLGDPGLVEQLLTRLGLLEADALLAEGGGTMVFRTLRHRDGRSVFELQRLPRIWKSAPEEHPTRLTVLQDILDVHGAEVWTDGPVEGGWTLAILLPAFAEDGAPPPPPAPAPLFRLDGRRALVAEDEPEMRYFLREILGRLGAEVVSAVDGADAWNLWNLLGPFDVLLTDHRMPRLTGLELLDKVRADRPGFPVVLMSGYDMEEFKDHLAQDPRLRYLAKPFKVQVLAEVLGDLLGESAPQA